MLQPRIGLFALWIRKYGKKSTHLVVSTVLMLKWQDKDRWLCARCSDQPKKHCIRVSISHQPIFVDVLHFETIPLSNLQAHDTITCELTGASLSTIWKEHKVQFQQWQQELARRKQKRTEKAQREKEKAIERKRKKEEMHKKRAYYAAKYELAVMNNDMETIKAITEICGSDPRSSSHIKGPKGLQSNGYLRETSGGKVSPK